MSNGEKITANILEELDIKYIYESKHKDLFYKSYLRFDFEFIYKEKIYVVEIDGIQHNHPISYFGGRESFLEQKKRDKIKDEYCENTNRILLRISYQEISYEKIKNKINNVLKLNIFNLNMSIYYNNSKYTWIMCIV